MYRGHVEGVWRGIQWLLGAWRGPWSGWQLCRGCMEGVWRVVEGLQRGMEWLLATIDLVGDNWKFEV